MHTPAIFAISWIVVFFMVAGEQRVGEEVGRPAFYQIMGGMLRGGAFRTRCGLADAAQIAKNRGQSLAMELS
jgi:hypothetical protein